MPVIFLAGGSIGAIPSSTPKFAVGDRVEWEHLPGKYRSGEVVDIDGTIGVQTDGDGVVYVEPRVLQHELTKADIVVRVILVLPLLALALLIDLTLLGVFK